LTRTFGDEKIRLTFTTADLNNNVPGEDMAEDGAFDDADMEMQSGGANTKGSINQGKTQDGNVRVAPEDRIAPADREELEEDYEEDGQQQGFPAHASIRIERPGKGALAIEATAQDGDFLIEDLYYFPSADLADPATAEKDWSRRTLYTGPPFNNLDEDLQILLEKYLEERGINTRLALFIPDYIDHKEQKEYIRWLNSKSSPKNKPAQVLTRPQTSRSLSSKPNLTPCCTISRFFSTLSAKWRLTMCITVGGKPFTSNHDHSINQARKRYSTLQYTIVDLLFHVLVFFFTY
jgi:hypothetical protein